MNDTFSRFHPVITFLFYICAMIFAMVFYHPAFLLAAFGSSLLYLLTVRGRKSLRFLFKIFLVFAAVTLLNPLLNTQGETILFHYWNNRPYTFEALRYGAAIGAMFCTVLLWFASYNATMTSDKFVYLFGKTAPSITLLLTMILRLVPIYRNKAKQIEAARQCVGKGVSNHKKETVNNLIQVLSALMSWALEGSLVSADSMSSRGYGCGRRTAFSTYRFFRRDTMLLVSMSVLAFLVFFFSAQGGTRIKYTPVYVPTPLTSFCCAAGLTAYLCFLLIPSIINLSEAVKWRFLRSKI